MPAELPLQITLINMPFADVRMPSLALTQLQSVLTQQFGARISVDIRYLNHDMAHYLGIELYNAVTWRGTGAHHTGLGEWFFRRAAFPHLDDNTTRYFRRFYPAEDTRTRQLRHQLLDKRDGLEAMLETMVDRYRLDQSYLIGFTSMFAQNLACFALARLLKERSPHLITVIGGANCEAPMGPEIARRIDHIDFVFSGPALRSLPRFVHHCLDQDLDQCHSINGVFSRLNASLPQVDGSTLGGERPITAAIELDYTSFLRDMETNFPDREVEPTLLFETSRGCWWGERAHCTFCGLNGLTMAYRAMPVEQAREQFRALFTYVPRVTSFLAVDNIMPKHYPQQVFAQLEVPPEVSMFYEVKSDLTEDDVDILARARITVIQPGIEALATPTLRLMKKGATAFQNIALLKHCAMYGVRPTWNLLIGFPGEDGEVYRKYLDDIPLLVHLPPPMGVFPVRFDRFSPYFTLAAEYGLDLVPMAYYAFLYPFDAEVRHNLAYYFADRNFSADYVVTMTVWMGRLRRAVTHWQQRWRQPEKGGSPGLFFTDAAGGTVVCDSRAAELIEYDIGQVGREILEGLMTPGRYTALTAHYSHRSQAHFEASLALLRERGLVFQEGDRMMSLVHRQPPPWWRRSG